MEIGTFLAVIEGVALHVIHCWEAYGETMLPGRLAGVARQEVDDNVDDSEKKVNAQLHGFLNVYHNVGDKQNIHCYKGDPGSILPVFARSQKIDVIIMGTVCADRYCRPLYWQCRRAYSK